MKHKAFTLAELLVAIFIIGILLLLTMPRIVDNMIKKNYVASLQRVYLAMSNATKIMLEDERTSSVERTYLYMTSGESVEGSAGMFLHKYFRFASDCQTSKTPCFADTYKTMDMSQNIVFPSDGAMYCGLLTMRASICLVPPQDEEKGIVFVDVNGPVKPNVSGRDLFSFYIYPDGYVGDREEDADQCGSSTSATGCFKKLIRLNWVMDY